MAQATYTIEELDTLLAAGFSAEFICRDLHTNPKAVATRLRRRGRHKDASFFERYATSLEKLSR